jgi:hypothetical protein
MAKKRARTAKKRTAAKKRPAKGAARAKVRNARARSSSSAAKVAERERPGWSAVAKTQIAADAAESITADATVPELSRLKQKYFGADGYTNGMSAPTADGEIVTMEPKLAGADLRPGRKASVVQKNRVIGHQG